MKVKIRLDEGATLPSYAHPTDAGMDVIATRRWTDEYGNICYGTGLHFQIPEGYVMLIFPRSSVSKYDLSLCNSVGVLDSGYTGELIFKFKPALAIGDNADIYEEDDPDNTFVTIPGPNPYINPDLNCYDFTYYEIGDKIGQIIIIPYPKVEFEQVNTLDETDRGDGGFGSTGK